MGIEKNITSGPIRDKMKKQGYLFGIVPETPVERKIVEDPEFRDSLNWGEPRDGHPEGKVGIHVAGILDWIDSCPWQNDRADLRLVAILHDIGKYKTQYSPNGHLIGSPHAELSEQIARKFISDGRILEIIKYHSRPFSFYRKEAEKGRFDQSNFLEVFSLLGLDLFTKFQYADLFDRDRTSIYWFEDKCLKLGLTKRKVSDDLIEVRK